MQRKSNVGADQRRCMESILWMLFDSRAHSRLQTDKQFKPVDENVDVGGGGTEAVEEEGDEGDDHQDCHKLPP